MLEVGYPGFLGAEVCQVGLQLPCFSTACRLQCASLETLRFSAAVTAAATPAVQAIAMTLFGQNDHLGGKLTYTMYPANYTSQVRRP